MNYFTAQDAAARIWMPRVRVNPELNSKLMELDVLELDLTYPELLSDEELIDVHELLGSIFHHPDWNRMHCEANNLPGPGNAFDFYCIERVYLALSRHAFSRAWEHSPKHADWINSFRSMTSTGGYVRIFDANDSFSLSDPAFSDALDAPTWYGIGSCWKPVNPGTLQIESMPKIDFILARMSDCKYA